MNVEPNPSDKNSASATCSYNLTFSLFSQILKNASPVPDLDRVLVKCFTISSRSDAQDSFDQDAKTAS